VSVLAKTWLQDHFSTSPTSLKDVGADVPCVVHHGPVSVPSAVDPAVSARMSNTRGRDTAAEMAVRRKLHRMGLRYRVNFRPVPGLRRTADIVFTRQRIAVLIDGCFWHACPDHYRPATGRSSRFWADKIEGNQRRDRESSEAFSAAGWRVLRFWEHEDPVTVADQIASVVHESACPTTSPASESPRT
jgi:DNA mismatch endonuclease, patch repair protein